VPFVQSVNCHRIWQLPGGPGQLDSIEQLISSDGYALIAHSGCAANRRFSSSLLCGANHRACWRPTSSSTDRSTGFVARTAEDVNYYCFDIAIVLPQETVFKNSPVPVRPSRDIGSYRSVWLTPLEEPQF
jgi:hypothetical protein